MKCRTIHLHLHPPHGEIQNNKCTHSEIQNNTCTHIKMQNKTCRHSEIQNNTGTHSEIQNNTCTHIKMQTNTCTPTEIQNNTHISGAQMERIHHYQNWLWSNRLPEVKPLHFSFLPAMSSTMSCFSSGLPSFSMMMPPIHTCNTKYEHTGQFKSSSQKQIKHKPILGNVTRLSIIWV